VTEMKQYVLQFWLHPMERIGDRKKKAAMISSDTGPQVRREMQAIIDGLKRKIAKLAKWKEEAMRLYASHDVLKELADEAQAKVHDLEDRNKLLVKERAKLLEEGRQWRIDRDQMKTLVLDTAGMAEHHFQESQQHDKERRILIRSMELAAQERATREAQSSRLITQCEDRKRVELEALQAEMDKKMKSIIENNMLSEHMLQGNHFAKQVNALMRAWRKVLYMRVVTRWRAYLDMERILLRFAYQADREAWLRNGKQAGWERRHTMLDRRPKGGTPAGYTTTLSLAVPSDARRMQEGILLGYEILEQEKKQTVEACSSSPGKEKRQRPMTAGSKGLLLRQTNDEALVGRAMGRHELKAKLHGWVPAERSRSSVMKLSRPQSAAEGRLKMICLKTLADLDPPLPDNKRLW